MGWDCWATKDGKRLQMVWFNCTQPYIEDEEINQAFLEQSRAVKDACGSVDGWLHLGGLDCSECAEMLELATGRNCWSDDGWSDEFTRHILIWANWDFNVKPEERWAYLSAKHFLDTCVSLGLGVEFSW